MCSVLKCSNAARTDFIGQEPTYTTLLVLRCETDVRPSGLKNYARRGAKFRLGERWEKRGPVSGDRAKQKAELNCEIRIAAGRSVCKWDPARKEPRVFTGKTLLFEVI